MTINEYNICVDQYADGIYRWVLKMSGNDMDAKDTVQNTFEKLWKRYEEVAFDSAKSFIFTTAYRDWIDQTRKVKRLQLTGDLPEMTGQEDRTFENQELLNYALQQLPDAQKSVILLRDYEGYSYEEIADITALSLSQVKVYIFRGRKRMQDILKKSLFDNSILKSSIL